MSKNRTENQGLSNWFEINNVGINFGEVVMINFVEQNVPSIILHLKSGANIGITNTSDKSDRELFQILSDYLKSIAEDEDRDKQNTFELLKSILSELKLISEKL